MKGSNSLEIPDTLSHPSCESNFASYSSLANTFARSVTASNFSKTISADLRAPERSEP